MSCYFFYFSEECGLDVCLWDPGNFRVIYVWMCVFLISTTNHNLWVDIYSVVASAVVYGPRDERRMQCHKINSWKMSVNRWCTSFHFIWQLCNYMEFTGLDLFHFCFQSCIEDRDGISVVGKWRRVRRRTELSWEGQMYQLLLCGVLSTCFQGVDKWSETSVDNHSTRQYNPEDSSEHSIVYLEKVGKIMISLRTASLWS
jgi:hypothetical protein